MEKYISDKNKGRRIATNSYINRYAFLWGKKIRLYKRDFYNPMLDMKCDILSDNTLDLFASKKIIVRGVARRLTATLDEEGSGLLVAVHAVIGIHYDNKFLLGLLNSKLFNWLHLKQFYSARIPEGSLRYPISFLANLPVCLLNLSDSASKAQHDKMVALVDVMLDLNKKIQIAKGNRKDQIQRQIAKTDGEIDELVYKLYGITEKERKVIEEGG